MESDPSKETQNAKVVIIAEHMVNPLGEAKVGCWYLARGLGHSFDA